MFFRDLFKAKMPDPGDTLPGRAEPIPTSETSLINGKPIKGPYPEGSEVAEFALGCFWGEEKMYWQQPGVIVTAVGYEGGTTPNPTYNEVSSGRTGHAETVRVVYDPRQDTTVLIYANSDQRGRLDPFVIRLFRRLR